MELETKIVGKSGGHTDMKSQSIENSEEKTDIKYELRENPRKTWRAENLETPKLIIEQKPSICKQCGKGFKSIKALSGHMACHSEKDRFFKDDESVWETDEGGLGRPKKAAAKKYKKAKSCGVSNNDSSVSGIDFEQEEVAMCLIMLSRDYGNWVGAGSNQESSDSVVLETKSSSINVKIGPKRDLECVYESLEIKKLGKWKWNLDTSVTENEESSDGYFETNGFKERRSEGGSRVKAFDTKIMKFVSKNKKKLKSKKKTKAHECPYCNRVFKSGQAMGGHKRTHFLGNSGNGNNRIIATVSKTETSEVKEMLDLNLPAPEEGEESEHSQYLNW